MSCCWFQIYRPKNNKLLFGKTNNKKKIRAMPTFMHWESKNSWKGQDQALNVKWYKSRPIADGGLNYTLKKILAKIESVCRYSCVFSWMLQIFWPTQRVFLFARSFFLLSQCTNEFSSVRYLRCLKFTALWIEWFF